MNVELALGLILLIHWFADFVLQTGEQALGKSSSWRCLLEHTITYSLFWTVMLFVGGMLYGWSISVLWFVPITFVCHTATDYITSREVKKRFDKKNYHDGFVIIGIDQILHYVQLYYTYKFLINT